MKYHQVMETFGDRLGRALSRRKLTPTDLHRRLIKADGDVSVASIYNWLANRNVPMGDTIQLIAAVLDCDYHELLGPTKKAR